MDEREWQEIVDRPRDMLEQVVGASDRKWRLFGCACYRFVWNFLDERACQRVEIAERYVDGQCTELEFAAAAAAEALTTHWESISSNQVILSRNIINIPTMEFIVNETVERRMSFVAHCNLLRDIFGNPFRPVTIDPRWLTSTVIDLADVIYAERAFDRLPILADALMDAGCDSEEIINHCRGPGPHVRGCWVVDLLLKKE